MGNAAPTTFQPDGELPDEAGRDVPHGAHAWRSLPLEGNFQFSYRDAAGRASLRQLIAHELKVGPGKLLLGGTDPGTGAYRGFRVDRIHFLEDVDGGEVIGRNVLDWLMRTALAQERARRRVRTAATRRGPRRPLAARTTRPLASA